MMTGGAVGTLLAAQVYNLIGHMGWRWVFYVGIVPALLLVFIRRGMVEPEHFAAVRERRRALAEAEAHAHSDEDKEFMRFVPLQLFNRQNRFSTLVGLCSASAHCSRSGPATSGCRRSSATSWPAKASRATTRSPISASG